MRQRRFNPYLIGYLNPLGVAGEGQARKLSVQSRAAFLPSGRIAIAPIPISPFHAENSLTNIYLFFVWNIVS
jgi:hypothetical protein